MGPGTAEELARYHLTRRRAARAISGRSAGGAARSATLAASDSCWPEPAAAAKCSAEELTTAGADVEQIVVYSSDDVPQADPEIAAVLADGQIDWITVTSSAIARSLAGMFGDNSARSRLASISPITSGTLRQLGYPPSAEATDYTMDGIVEAIVSAESTKK